MRKTFNAKLVPMEGKSEIQQQVTHPENVQVVTPEWLESYTGNNWQAQRLVITDEAGADVAVYPKYELAPIPQIDLSDIRRWIDEGCKSEVELEVIKYFSEHLGGTVTDSPLLTNNTVKMVWGEVDKSQPIAGEVEDAAKKYAHMHEDVSDKLGKHLVKGCFVDGANWREHRPATDWDVLRDKFKSFMTHKTAVTISDIGVDAIFNFFKNEINGK